MSPTHEIELYSIIFEVKSNDESPYTASLTQHFRERQLCSVQTINNVNLWEILQIHARALDSFHNLFFKKNYSYETLK